MKLFICADIEGTAGIVDWEEARLGTGAHEHFARNMTGEVNAACEGAIEAGVSEILIKDAHGTARNIIPDMLPREAKVFRGWARNPYIMMAGMDASFDAVAMTGCHSRAGCSGNPLSHTMDDNIRFVTINGNAVGEYEINAFTAAYFKVPVVFVSGDEAVCKTAASLNGNVKTVGTIRGVGAGNISMHPAVAVEKIKQGVCEAMKGDLSNCLISLPKDFTVLISFSEHFNAYKASFYPGAKQTSPTDVTFQSPDYFEVLRFLFFVF